MVTSLDKLTSKSISNKNGYAIKENKIQETQASVQNNNQSKNSIQKRFIAEVTQEVLIVTESSLFISKTDQVTGMTYLHQLNDIKDVLDMPN